MAAVTMCSDFGTQENKVCYCCHCFPIYLPWSDGTGCHDLYFLNVVFFFSSMVTAQSFIRQTKDSIPSRRDGTPTPKERPQSILASSFYTCVSSSHPLEFAPCKLVWPRRGRVCFTWSSHSGLWIFFCSTSMGFSLSLSFSHAILDSFFLF